jgi:hypothetical protein
MCFVSCSENFAFTARGRWSGKVKRTPLVFAGLRKVYPYYFTFTTFTKGRWVGEKILDVFAREFRAHPAEEYVSKV